MLDPFVDASASEHWQPSFFLSIAYKHSSSRAKKL